MLTNTIPSGDLPLREPTRFRVLGAISFSHFLNDMIQSLILALYPLLKADFRLSFAQIGLITLTYQMTASVLQPFIGMYTDRYPQPRALAIGMGFTLLGLLSLIGGAKLCHRDCGRGARRRGVIYLSSGVIARSAPCLGRPTWTCAVHIPSGRQCGLGGGPIACRVDHHSLRPNQRRLVLARCAHRHLRTVADRRLVSAPACVSAW